MKSKKNNYVEKIKNLNEEKEKEKEKSNYEEILKK